MVAFAIRSASATLPNTRPSAVHILNHPLPDYAVTDRLPLIVRATPVACLQDSTGVLVCTTDSIKVVLEDRQMAARNVEEPGAGGACREFGTSSTCDE